MDARREPEEDRGRGSSGRAAARATSSRGSDGPSWPVRSCAQGLAARSAGGCPLRRGGRYERRLAELSPEERGHTLGYGFASPAGRIRTWRGFTPLAGPTIPSRSLRSMIFAALLLPSR